MENLVGKIILSSSLFCMTLLTGVWLTHQGRPLNSILFNLHKLLALGFSAWTMYGLIQISKWIQFPALLTGLFVIGGLCLLALFITGAFLSFEKTQPGVLHWIHKLSPILLAAALLSAISQYVHR